jgi:hypothetical protein
MMLLAVSASLSSGKRSCRGRCEDVRKTIPHCLIDCDQSTNGFGGLVAAADEAYSYILAHRLFAASPLASTPSWL